MALTAGPGSAAGGGTPQGGTPQGGGGEAGAGQAAAAPCFTLVCLRRLEEEIPLDGSVSELALSHDRRLLSLRDERSRCICYSCDNARPAFRLPEPAVLDVEQSVWAHLPAEKSILVHRNVLSEYPGTPCLAALQRGNTALVFCRFFKIRGPDATILDWHTPVAEAPSRLSQGAPLLSWGVQELPEALPVNTVWRHAIPLAQLLSVLPDCRFLLQARSEAAGGDSAEGADDVEAMSTACQHLKVRLCSARPDVLVLFVDDILAMLLTFSWRGVTVSHCFFLQRPEAGLSSSPAGSQPDIPRAIRFCDVVACQDWIFAITPPPLVYCLIWHITGVAFHAIPLGEYLREDVYFVSLVVALDLLGVALCDNHNDIWTLSLDRYFDSSPKGLDWETLKEKQRCAEGVAILEQTSRDYQALSVFPEAFGLQPYGDQRASTSGRLKSATSVMDCLVEGVPTYGIPIPGGAFGSGDQFFGRDQADSLDAGEGEGVGGGTSSQGQDINVMRCIPYAWHERIYQTQEWLDLDRPWTIARTERPDHNLGLDPSAGGPAASGSPNSQGPGGQVPTGMLNGFSVPAQHRLGDDDLHYSLYAAVHKHARRVFQSRLPPWLTQTSLPRQAQQLNPPMIGMLGEMIPGGADSDSADELAEESPAGVPELHVPTALRSPLPGEGRFSSAWSDRSGSSHEGISAQMTLPSQPAVSSGGGRARRPRRKVVIGRVSLSITASHVFCEIWEAPGAGGQPPDRPWGLCVLPRPPSLQRGVASAQNARAHLDRLTGGLGEVVGEASASWTSQHVVSFRSRRCWRSLVTQNHIWYMLGEHGSLYSLLLNQSPVRVISNLLVFENRAKASRLCALNGWNATQLPVLTLFLGLRFRELEEISHSLGLLRPDQEMEACQMIMDFIHSGYSCVSLTVPFSPSPPVPLAMLSTGSGGASEAKHTFGRTAAVEATAALASSSQLPADRSFVSRLLEIAMQFVTKLIQTRVAQVQECEGACRALTYLQPKHAASEPPQYASMVHELSQLTVHMQSLRGLQQQLVRSFGDEKAYDSGIVIHCPPQEDALDQAKALPSKTGLKSLDTAVALATRQQLGSMRSVENTEEVVRGALISGRVSSALNWFHELALEEGARGGAAGGRVFDEFRATAGRIAYQLVCNQQLDFLFVAMHMLRNVGESVNRFFKAVAFHTSKRLVRRRLLKHVDHMGRLTKDEQSLISLVNLLERLYTNPCYTTEFNRMTTGLTTGQYPQRAHSDSLPPFYTWPAGGRSMLLVGLSCDGAIGGHVAVDATSEDLAFEQQTSLRELPMSQRMPLELYDMWAGYQTPVMAAMLEMPGEARRAWSNLPCGDIDDLDSQPVLGLSNFHKGSNLEKDQDASVADMREGSEDSDVLQGQTSQTAAKTTCLRCRLEGLKDDLDFELPHHGAEDAKEDFFEALGIGDGSRKHHTMGYLHVTLSWMRRWSWDTRARIIMEKTHYWPTFVESLKWLQPPADLGLPDKVWRNCWLDFVVAHQDWRGLASWVRRMPLRHSDRVDDHGRSCVDLTHLEERGLPCCTSYTKEILLQELGRRGIFCRGDVHSFSALLRRLAQCGRLFGEAPAVGGRPLEAVAEGAGEDDLLPAEGVLPLDRLLPTRAVCPFHQFFIHFCIDHDLPTVMLLYLQKYELGTTISCLQELKLRHAEKPWASLLLVGRLGNAHLFAASLQNAATVFGGQRDDALSSKRGANSKASGVRHDLENVFFMPLNGLASHSSVAFLATLMFAPVASAIDAASAPRSDPWFVDLDLFKQVVSEYPALKEAFFPGGLAAAPAPRASVGQGGDEPGPGLGMSLVESVAKANHARWHGQEPHGAEARAGEPPEDERAVAAGLGPLAEEKAHRTLDDMVTFKEDVSLATLLGDVAAFDVQGALQPLPIFGREPGGEVAADGSLATLLKDEEQFHDELGEGYYLAQGRAMMAFHVITRKCLQRMDPSEELRFPLVLPADEAKRLHKVAKSVALHNLLNEGVVSSAVCLLELCSLETEVLRVDVQAAKRIYEHYLQQGQGLGVEEEDRPRAAAASVIELFLAFPDIEEIPSRAAEAAINSVHLLKSLRMLEESTWALDPHPSAPTASSSLQALAYDSPWHLVALFCRVHSLPRSLTLLHELARNNDWVMFLHESDLQQCPADTVLDIVDGYFTDVPLQSHLRILAHSIAAQEHYEGIRPHLAVASPGAGSSRAGGGRVGGADRAEQPERKEPRGAEEAGSLAPQVSPGKLKADPEARQVADAIGFLEQCRGKTGGGQDGGTGWGLLRHALSNRTARLAVMASAFNDVSTLRCMAVWLSVNMERSQGPSTEAALSQQCTPAEVAAQIALLCRKSHAYALVLRALKIFDPDNPLIDYVRFHRAFMQCRFQSCSAHLQRFVQRRNSESQEGAATKGPYCLQLVPYVTQFSEDMVQNLLDNCPRARMMLLSALDQASFSPHYSHLFRSFRLVQQMGLDVDFRMPASELLQLLISRKMFAEAREWARSSGIVGDTIVFEEVTGMIVEFRQGVWWNVLDERLQLWHKCYDAFLRQSYPPVGAALFFLDLTSKLEPDLFAREQLMLLCIAFELLSSAEGGDAGDVKDTFESASKQPRGPDREQLSRIKLSMLLILTGTNKDLAAELDFSPLDLSYGTLRTLVHRIPESVTALPLYHAESSSGGGVLPMWGSAAGAGPLAGASSAPDRAPEQRGPQCELLPFLETAISSLINCDETAWAGQLASGFGFESADLRLARAMELVASGRQREALSDLRTAPQPPPLAEAAEGGDVERLLQSLSTQCSSRISLFCRRRMVFFSVSRAIGMEYREVSQVDVGELLDRLLSPEPYVADITLCRSLLACYPRQLNMAALAKVLASRFLRSTLGPGAREWPEDKLDEFVSLLGSSQEQLGDAALCRIPNFRRSTDIGGGADDGSPSLDQEHEELPFECEAEVLIMAYRAYVQACREQSIGELLRFLRGRVELYVDRGRFPLLVRLLVAIPEYHAMEYMFGHLLRCDRLDLLLELGRCKQDSYGTARKTALAVALVRYLQDHFPRNLELLVQVHLCFSMEAQLACLLEHKAQKLARGLGRKWEKICSEDGEEQLLMCLSLYLQCSRFFLQGKRYQRHLIANEYAALICLQLKAVQIHLAASLQEQQNARREAPPAAAPAGAPLPAAPACPGDALAGAEAAGEAELGAAGAGDGLADEEAHGLPAEDSFRESAAAAAAAVAGEAASAAGLPVPGNVGPAAAGATLQPEDAPPRADACGPAGGGLTLGPAGDPFVVINLEAREVEVFVEYHHDFVVAFQVVSAYRHSCGEGLFKVWPRALYRQVVLLGNRTYLPLFVRHLPLTKEYLEATVRLYLNEPCPEEFPLRAQRMKQYLREGVPNLETRFQLTRQLGSEFADISMEIAPLVYMA